MGRMLPWVGYCYGSDIAMGRILLWVGYCHGSDIAMGRILLWVGDCYALATISGGLLPGVFERTSTDNASRRCSLGGGSYFLPPSYMVRIVFALG